MHPDRMHMQRHDTSHQSHQGQSDATVAGRCAHHPIIRPRAPVAGITELGRKQLALGWDRGPCPAQRTSISATTDLNRQIVYVSARASPTFLNSPSLEPSRRSGPISHQKITLSNRNAVVAENDVGDGSVNPFQEFGNRYLVVLHHGCSQGAAPGWNTSKGSLLRQPRIPQSNNLQRQGQRGQPPPPNTAADALNQADGCSETAMV